MSGCISILTQSYNLTLWNEIVTYVGTLIKVRHAFNKSYDVLCHSLYSTLFSCLPPHISLVFHKFQRHTSSFSQTHLRTLEGIPGLTFLEFIGSLRLCQDFSTLLFPLSISLQPSSSFRFSFSHSRSCGIYFKVYQDLPINPYKATSAPVAKSLSISFLHIQLSEKRLNIQNTNGLKLTARHHRQTISYDPCQKELPKKNVRKFLQDTISKKRSNEKKY